MNRLDLIRTLILYNFKLSIKDIKKLLDIVNRLELLDYNSVFPRLYLKGDKQLEYRAVFLDKPRNSKDFVVNASMRYTVAPKYFLNKDSDNNLKIAKIFIAELEILK